MTKIAGSRSISQRHGSADPYPDPSQNVMDPQHWRKHNEKEVGWKWLILCRHSHTPDIDRSYQVIWKDLWWRADSHRHLKYRGGCTIPLFQLRVWCEKCVAARHNGIIGKQLFISNDRHRVRWELLGLSQDGICARFFWKFQHEELKQRPTFNSVFWSFLLD